MAQRKPKNEFEEQKERQKKARQKAWNAAKEKLIRERTGITRHNHKLTIQGVPVHHLIGAPTIACERWGKNQFGTRIHVALLVYRLQADDGREFTVRQAQVHETKHGYMLTLSRFWGLTPA